MVRDALAGALDDAFILVHSLHLPGLSGDVDAVVLGPRVVVLEIKTYSDARPLRVRGARWEYSRGPDRWAALDTQPSSQARASARAVRYALRSARLPAYNVVPAVVLVGGAPCVLDHPAVPVLRPAQVVPFVREGAAVTQRSWPSLALRALVVAAGHMVTESP